VAAAKILTFKVGIFLHFYLLLFKNMNCNGILSFQKGFVVDVLDFQIELDVDILAFLVLATVLATFQKNLGKLFLFFWSHWLPDFLH
jgi:hypothetical protein